MVIIRYADILALTLPLPAKTVTDATFVALHHSWIGLGIALFSLALTWNDALNENPATVFVGILNGAYGFLTRHNKKE